MSLRSLLRQLGGAIEMPSSLAGFLAGLLQLSFIELFGGGCTGLRTFAGGFRSFLRRPSLILQT